MLVEQGVYNVIKYNVAIFNRYINSFYQCVRWRDVNPPSPYFHVVDFIAGQSGKR